MAVIDDKSRKEISKRLQEQLKNEVDVIIYTVPAEGEAGEYNEFAQSFLNELAALNPLIKIREADPDDELVKKTGLSTSPSIILGAEKGVNILYNGVPAGYEAAGFIELLILVSSGKTNFSDELKTRLGSVKNKTLVQVFVTPSCPYCPQAFLLAARMALDSKGMITAECVEAQENPELSRKFNVSSVPQQVINGERSSVTVGVPQEQEFIDQVLKYAEGQESS